MPAEIYILHPGVGQNRATDGAQLKIQSGVNFAYIEQQFLAGVDHTSFFHGIVVPPNFDNTQPVNVRTVWRQTGIASTNDIIADVLFRAIAPPDDRDGSALASVGAQNVTMSGTVGDEVGAVFSIPGGSFASGQEVLLGVSRKGSSDSFLGAVALELIELTFALLSEVAPQTLVYRPGGVAGGNVFINWDNLYTKRQALQGEVTIQIDTSISSPAVIGGSLASYNLSNTVLIGVNNQVTQVTFTKPLSGLPTRVGPNVFLTNGMVGVPVYVLAGSEVLVLGRDARLIASATAPFLQVTGNPTLYLYGGVLSSSPIQSVNVANGGTLTLIAFAASIAFLGSISSDSGGTLLLRRKSTSDQVIDPTPFDSFNGTFLEFLDSNSIYESYDPTISGLTSTNVKEAIDEIAASSAVGQWTNAGTYLRPTVGAGIAVSIGTTNGPLSSEKLRIEGNARVSGYLILGNSHPEGAGVELRFGSGTTLPLSGSGWGRGSLFTRSDNGKLYVNVGTSAAVSWIVVGSQSP